MALKVRKVRKFELSWEHNFGVSLMSDLHNVWVNMLEKSRAYSINILFLAQNVSECISNFVSELVFRKRKVGGYFRHEY